MDYEESGSTAILSADSLDIPEYLTYVILIYRLASAVFVIGMGSLIISTIVKTRSLHNVHNILIINLIVADIATITAYTFQTTGMMFSYLIGIQDPFRCDVLYFSLFPVIMIMYTFVMLSLDKFIAIKFALRYNTIATRRRAYLVITAGWIITLLFRIIRLIYELTADTEYDKSSQFGCCSLKQRSVLVSLFTTLIPLFFACFITITLDVYLSIKAYQMYKKIQEENDGETQVFKDKLSKILQQLKPMITLLVTILGSMGISAISSIVNIYVTTLMVEDNSSYQMFVKYIILSNSGILTVTLHPLVYGLYFREIRQPLCRRFKWIVQSCKCKTKRNTILPSQASSGQSRKRAWM